MSKEIDAKEDKRLDVLEHNLTAGKVVSTEEIFDGELIPSILKNSPRIIMDCIDQANLPINCLLYPRVYGVFYKNCTLASNPQLLKPYLEKEQLLPILQAPLSEYKSDFVNLIVQYPYINSQELTFLRWAEETDWDGLGGLCFDCFEKKTQSIMKKFNTNYKSARDYSNNRLLLETSFPNLNPTYGVESNILDEIDLAVERKRLASLPFLRIKSEIVSTLRNSEIFEAAPQMSLDDLSIIRHIAEDLNSKRYPALEEEHFSKEWMAKSLCIDYNSKLSTEEYLDIIIPRKKKINRILGEFLETKKSQPFQSITEEIWKINSELAQSKSLENYTFAVSFAQNNWKVIFGMMMGALIGFSSGSLTACTVGGGLGTTSAIADKIMQGKGIYKMPKYPKKTIEWIKAKIEDPQEKLIALLLSKDVKTIQLWNLRRKLGQT